MPGGGRAGAESHRWADLSAADRRQVLRLARRGERHPDEAVAATAARWAVRPATRHWWNRAPGFLLPLFGALIAVGGFFAHSVVLTVGGVIVLALGLLGWNTKNCTVLVHRVYSAPPESPGQ